MAGVTAGSSRHRQIFDEDESGELSEAAEVTTGKGNDGNCLYSRRCRPEAIFNKARLAVEADVRRQREQKWWTQKSLKSQS
jgi:hypothetical protein